MGNKVVWTACSATRTVLLIIFSICCNGIAFILGIIGLIVCTDPIAKRNALIVTILGVPLWGRRLHSES